MSAEAFPLVRIRGSLGAAGQTENSLAELRRSPILRSWTYALRASANFGIELAPIGSDYECETGTDPPSSRETSTLPDKGGSPCHAPSIPHQAHLATVFGLAAAKGDEPSALLPPPRHRQRDFESPSHRHADASVEIRTPYSAGAYQTGEIQGALLVGGADGHEPVRVDDPLRDRPEPSPSAVTSPEGRPAPRATSGRRARRPPRPTPPVSSSRFSRPRWQRRPVASSPGAAVGRRCLLDAR